MNRTWWTHIQTIAPRALEACKRRFAERHPSDWRARIQHGPTLVTYFHEMHKLELHTSRVAGGAQPYGYRLAGRQWKVNRSRYYASAPEAMWSGLTVAFALVEVDLRREPYLAPAERPRGGREADAPPRGRRSAPAPRVG